MASKTLALTSFLITFNILFFTLVSSNYLPCPPPEEEVTPPIPSPPIPRSPASPPGEVIPPTPVLPIPPSPASPPGEVIPPTPVLPIPPSPASPPGEVIPPTPVLPIPPSPATPGEVPPPTPSTPPTPSCECQTPPEGCNGGAVTTPTPSPSPSPSPSPLPSKETCPVDTLKLGVCGDVLSLVNIVIGSSSNTPCCTLVEGLTDLDAAVCLCTAIKANVLGLNLNAPVSLSLLLNYCDKKSPSGFQCA